VKLLFYVVLFGLIVLLNVGIYIPSLLAVNEEDIGRNINSLKKYNWFQDLLGNNVYHQLIVHDKDVRRVIGKFDNNRIDKNLFQNKYRKKLQSILQQKSNHFA
jgi:hypothetical protein